MPFNPISITASSHPIFLAQLPSSAARAPVFAAGGGAPPPQEQSAGLPHIALDHGLKELAKRNSSPERIENIERFGVQALVGGVLGRVRPQYPFAFSYSIPPSMGGNPIIPGVSNPWLKSYDPSRPGRLGSFQGDPHGTERVFGYQVNLPGGQKATVKEPLTAGFQVDQLGRESRWTSLIRSVGELARFTAPAHLLAEQTDPLAGTAEAGITYLTSGPFGTAAYVGTQLGHTLYRSLYPGGSRFLSTPESRAAAEALRAYQLTPAGQLAIRQHLDILRRARALAGLDVDP